MEDDVVDSLKMVFKAIETHSIERAERLASRMVELINSEDCHKYLNEKKIIWTTDLNNLMGHLNESFLESMKFMRHLVVDHRFHVWFDLETVSTISLSPSSLHYILTDASGVIEDDKLSPREKIRKILNELTEPTDKEEDVLKKFDEYIAIWRKNTSLRGHQKLECENQMTKDFKDGLKERHTAMEKFIDSLRQDFKDLESKLVNCQQCIAEGEAKVTYATFVAAVTGGGLGTFAMLSTGGLAAIPIAAIALGGVTYMAGSKQINDEIRTQAGDRFVNRKHPSWYPTVEGKLFDYIRGRVSDKDLQQMIEKEQLEEDLELIRHCMLTWVERIRKTIDGMKIPKLSSDAIVAEIKRMWAFTKAALLNDSEEETKLHSKLLDQMLQTACSTGDGVAPLISMGRLPTGSTQLTLKLVVAADAEFKKVDEFVRKIAQLTGGNVRQGKTKTSEIIFEVHFTSGEGDDLRVFISRFVGRLAELAELHVRVAMIGDYEINSGLKLINPAYNRIYGRGMTASGFMPTVFGYLDYSGEKYFCPSGWRRISINVANSSREFDERYGGWHVAYHGTNHELAATILTSGFVPSHGAFSDGEKVVYFSPSIVYASHKRYAKVYQINDKNGKQVYMQMVLQVRVNPANIWKKIGGTLKGAFPPSHRMFVKDRDENAVDKNFPNNENLEWLVKPIPGISGIDMFRKAFVIYGIMIKISDSDPEEDAENVWWKLRV